MKFKSLLSIAAVGLAMAACQSPEGKSLGQISDASKADSLIYYFGQMRGAEYLREADADTTLATKQAKQEYLNGVKAGLNAVKANKDAYNNGVFLGMQMAMNMAQFKNDYDVTLSNRVFLESLAEAIGSDSIGNPQEFQKEFYRIMGEFNKQKEDRDKEEAVKALEETAGNKKMAKITDNLYGNVAKADGVKVKDGDKIKLDIKITDSKGNNVNAPLPSSLVVGQRMKDSPLNDAILSLCSGQKGTFLTTAYALFGARSSQMGVEPDDVLTIEMTPTIEEEAKEAPAEK